MCKQGIAHVRGDIDIIYDNILITSAGEYVHRETGAVNKIKGVFAGSIGDGILVLDDIDKIKSMKRRIILYDNQLKEVGNNRGYGEYNEYIKKVQNRNKEFIITIGTDLGWERV